MFAETSASAQASVVINSLQHTAKANGSERYMWLYEVLRDLPAYNTVEPVELLLPWNLSPR